MIEELKKNVETEIQILREMSSYLRKAEVSRGTEQKLLIGTAKSLQQGMKILNSAIPGILKDISAAQSLPVKPSKGRKEKSKFERVSFKRGDSELKAIVHREDREKFLEGLSISEDYLRRLKKGYVEKGEEFEEFRAARGYLKLSNKFFLSRATDLVNKGHFKALYVELRKSNLTVLFEAYLAMIFFTTFLSIFVGLAFALFFLFFNLGFTFPFISFYSGNYALRILQVIFIPIIVPVLTFFVLYFYPFLEKKSIGKAIDQELPFAVINMSAVSGSGIPPTQIFKIIGLRKEYPALRKEIRKVLNQINLYGYDLVTALNNAAKNSPSENLADLFGGLSTTIHSGGSMQSFFEKRSETLLLKYRLDREKYSKTAETLMDIYISVVIAAPMILMLLLIMISVANLGLDLNQFQIVVLMISAISIINIAFLVFLRIKQPPY